MNGDVIDHIVRFMEREEDQLPARVTNGMILMALREEREERKREIKEVVRRVETINYLLNGKEPDGSDGLTRRVAAVERFKNLVVWALSTIALAFLGGVGMALLNGMLN